MRERAYVDTSILVGTVIDKHKRAKEFKSLLNHINSKYEVVIPQIVIGECVAKIVESIKENKIQEESLRDFIHKIIDIAVTRNLIPSLSWYSITLLKVC